MRLLLITFPFSVFLLSASLLSLPVIAPQLGWATTLPSPSLGNPLEESLKNQNCEIWDDDQGIPHIHAKDERIGIACLGYVHARDRAWQLDYFKKTVQGRKAEFFGRDHIRTDFFLRLLGLEERANALFEEMSPSQKEIFWAYTWGVNRGLKEAIRQGVYEFEQFNYTPDSWRPQDTIAISLLQAFDQTRRNFVTQLEDFSRSQTHGESAPAIFDPTGGLPWDTSILKRGEYSSPSTQSSSTKTPPISSDTFTPSIRITQAQPLDLRDYEPILGGPDMGSNSWVLAPQRSQSGKAWLANDPHLKLSRPSFWKWVHLDAGKIDAIGASVPGVPVIFSGTNRHVSWGLTNSFLPSAKVTFVSNQELAQAKTYWPLIWVKVWKFKLPFIFKSYQKTASQLPILPVPDLPEGKSVILRWTGFDLRAKDFLGMNEYMKARSVQEFDQALRQIGVPSWNFNFADDQGSIGYRAIGRIYRPSQRHLFSIPTQTLTEVENNPEFSNPLSLSEMPHALNPERGFIVTANNTHWPDQAPLNSGRAPFSAFRAFRIEELLQSSPKHNLESNRKIQCDVQSVDARFILPRLLTAITSAPPFEMSEKDREALFLLKAWNFESQTECVACGIYRTWVNALFKNDKLNSVSLYRKLGSNSSSDWIKLLRNSFQESVTQLTDHGTKNFPKWGDLHRNYFRHLARPDYQVLAPLGTPGDDNTVNPGSGYNPDDPFEHTDGASHRLLVEMTSPPSVYSILPGQGVDQPVQSMAGPDSPWQEWIQCHFKKRHFPVDWSQVGHSSVNVSL